MKSSTIIWIVVVLLIVGGGWYWYSTKQASDSVMTDEHPSDAMGLNGSPNQGNMGDGTDVSQNLVLGVSSDADLGDYLTAYNGMTLYLYTKDTAGVSNCSGTCAVNWPPYTVPSADAIHVPASITGAVGTIARADGSLQVTYKGIPLYFWKNDAKPGDPTGQNVGGVWFVVQP